MFIRRLLPSLYQLRLGLVNAFLIEDRSSARSSTELILIDAGYPGYAPQVMRAIHRLGHEPKQVRHILVTHCHYDHIGSLAAIKHETGAPASMHPLDAVKTRGGETRRPWKAAPGLLNAALYQVFVKNAPHHVEPAEVETHLHDGECLPLAGGIQVVHTPGHCAGHVALLWQQHGGVLFAGDAANNIPNLRLSIVYEDLAEGRASLKKIAALQFEHACFGHGGPILGGADQRFRKRFTC